MPPDLPAYLPPEGPLVVLHQDRDLLVVDKPAGLLSVAGREPGWEDSAEARARALVGHAWAAHRLDMHTSGVLVFAVRRSAERHLMAQFAARTTGKVYEAVVAGVVVEDEGVIDLPLSHAPSAPGSPPRNVVDVEGGFPARTRFRVVAREADRARVELFPETGRSHQLRVHLLAIGHPILGDLFYAPAPVRDAAPRLLLHARELSLDHPWTGERLTFVAPTPF